MRNRTRGLLVVALIALIGGGAYGQSVDLRPLYSELATVFDELGKDTLPFVQQFGLIMDGTGRAEVGKGVFVSVSGGSVFLPGVATFRAQEPSPLQFLDLDSLLGPAIAGSALASSLYEGSKTFFMNPGLRLSAGLALAQGIEVWGHFGMVPNVVGSVVGLIPAGTLPAELGTSLAAMELSRMNAGGRVRFVLVKDQKGLPAVSVGAGYTYTRFGLVLPGLFSLIPEILPGLALDGTMVARTSLHTAGVELGLSKKLLFVAPFLRMGAWYQWASYTGGIDGFAVTLGGVPQPGVEVLEPQVRSIHDLAFVAAAGIELVLGKASLIAQGSYDTASASPAASGTFQLRF